MAAFPEVWTPDKLPIDYIIYDGAISPGYAEIDADSKRGLQVMAGRGWNDALIRFTGFEAQEFSVILHLQSYNDWVAWHNWKRHVAKRLSNDSIDKQVAQAKKIWHPFLADPTIAIKSAIVKNVATPKKVGDEGFWDIPITFIGYRKPKVSYAKYEGDKAPDGDTANGKIIRQNSDTIAKLMNTPAAAPK